MKCIIFNDKENFDRSLNQLNKKRALSEKRFWKIGLFHNFICEKVAEIMNNQINCLELVKSLIYTGEYNQKVLFNARKNCHANIKEMVELIEKEDSLLKKVSQIKDHDDLRKEVTEHVDLIKNVFERNKQKNIEVINQQIKNSKAQEKLFSYIRERLPFTELRTTPLVTRQGIIQQKGVDAKFSTDLLLLAQSNAFDIAILLTGDADLKECIKLIRERYGKIVFIIAYHSPNPEEKRFNTISEDLLNECDYFINLYDLSESEILKISDLRR